MLITQKELQDISTASHTCFDGGNHLYWQNFTRKINERFAEELAKHGIPGPKFKVGQIVMLDKRPVKITEVRSRFKADGGGKSGIWYSYEISPSSYGSFHEELGRPLNPEEVGLVSIVP